MIATWILFACSGTVPGVATSPTHPPTEPPTEPQAPTELAVDPRPADIAGRPLPVRPDPPPEPPEFLAAPGEAIRDRDLPLRFSGVGALCEGDALWASVEYIGPIAEATVTPWIDCAPTPSIPLTAGRAALFVQASGAGTVPRCDEATWVWELSVAGQEPACMVTGPDTATVLAELHEGCLEQ